MKKKLFKGQPSGQPMLPGSSQDKSADPRLPLNCGEACAGFLRDACLSENPACCIRAQHRRQESIAAASARLAAIDTVDAIGEAVALLNMDGSIRNVNAAFTALTELAESDLQRQDIRRLLPEMFEEESGDTRHTNARVALKRSHKNPEDALCVITSRGVRKWVVPTLSVLHGENDEPVNMVLALRDITTLMDAQAKVRESERAYRELVENVNSVIMRVARDNRIMFFNEYAQNFFGYSAEELIGKSVIGTIAPDVDSEGREIRKMMEELMEHSELHRSSEAEYICKDGKRVWVNWSNRAIRDDQGRVKEILCVGVDITVRKRLELEATAYKQRMRELADRFVVAEELERRRISTHIHDTVIQTLSLSNIKLGSIRGAVEAAGLDEQTEKLDRIRNLLDNGISECRGLMADLTPPLLYEVGLESALRAFAGQQQKLHDQRIIVEVDKRFKAVDADRRGLLFQSVRELVTNAIKYAGSSDIHIRLSLAGKDVCIEVCDTGKGFDRDKVDLFHPHAEGGFGLFNIRERLYGLGGRLEIDSALGKGTTARIFVPQTATGSEKKI